MTFTISGRDMTGYIAFGGLKWQRSDVDGPNAGRSMDGTMIRDRRASKIRWDVTCRPLTKHELADVLTLIKPEFVTVTFSDPETASTRTAEFYANNFPAQFAIIHRNGTEYWSGLTFPLIEK